MAIENRKDLLKKRPKPKIKEVFVEQWDDSVFLKMMNAAARDAYTQQILKIDDEGNTIRDTSCYRAKLLAATMCDSKGNLLFDPTNDKDINLIGELDSDVVQKLYDEALQLNKMREQDIEEAVKNSENDRA